MLSNMILRDIVFRSRTVNKKICEQYDGIVTRITTIPDSTEDLVTLMKFLEKLELKELLDLKVSDTLGSEISDQSDRSTCECDR